VPSKERLNENSLDIKRLLKNKIVSQPTMSLTKDGQQKKSIAAFDNSKGYYEVKGEEDKTLVFESRFESGNLGMTKKISDQEYLLLL
jgi:hypothetical protein